MVISIYCAIYSDFSGQKKSHTDDVVVSQTQDTWRYSYRKREDFGLQLVKLVVARPLPANQRNARIVNRKPRVQALPCFCERPGLLLLAVFTCDI